MKKKDDTEKAVSESSNSRRKLLKTFAAGSGAVVAGKNLPESWTRPVVDSVMLPAHAQTSPCSPTIVDIAAGNSDFSTLVLALQTAGLVETLSGPGPFTVYAPTNQAFTDSGITDLPSDPPLTDILLFHVQSGRVNPPNLPTSSENPQPQITGGPIEACNGLIYVIDRVLIP